MSAAAFPWQKAQWQQVMRAVAQDRLGHALLLPGPRGVGIRRFADQLACTLLCKDNEPANRPCGACAGCQQFHAGTHPDAFRVEPEAAGKALGIEAVRALIDRTRLKAAGSAKVGIVDPADALTTAAANSLLKTLEEPPAGTCLLLVCNRLARIPATIRSRCQQIGFPIPERRIALAWLAGEGIDNGEHWLALAGGRPVAARDLARADDNADGDDPAEILLQVALGRMAPTDGAAALRSRDLQQVIPAWVALVEDLLRAHHVPGAELRFQSRREAVDEAAARLDARALFHYLDALYRSVPGPSSSLNADMQIQGLLADALKLGRDGATVREESHG